MKIQLLPLFSLFCGAASALADDTIVTAVRDLPTTMRSELYTPNAAPLAPTPLIELPPGVVLPKGWLKHQLELDAEGIPGRLDEISRFLQFNDDNGWASSKGQKTGGEEVPYWLRGYVDLGYVLHDQRIIENTKKWMDAIIATAQPDGYFGPNGMKSSTKNGVYEAGGTNPLQLIMFPLRSYYEYTEDPRVLVLMSNYYKWVDTQPDSYFKASWGAFRWADHLIAIYWLYNRTKDPSLLALATRIKEHTIDFIKVGNTHNVNWSQGFRLPGEYSMQTDSEELRSTPEKNYDKIMSLYGQFPGGGLGGDEDRRVGYLDPRQGMETCGYVEYMLSFEILQRITGNAAWGDRCEEIAFNSLPATVAPDHRSLHYITSANSIDINNEHKNLGQFGNGPFPMQGYEPSPHNYRCCSHNYGMGWPYFTRSLWAATEDHGLCAPMYSPCEVQAKAGDGTQVKITEETEYPFSDSLTFTIDTPKAVAFPLYFRIPGWSSAPQFQINGQSVPVSVTPLSYVRIAQTWKSGDVISVRFPMGVRLQKWEVNRNSQSVYYGPLNFSLDIKEKWSPYVPEKYTMPNWGGHEVSALTAWNYGLALDSPNQTSSFEVVRKLGPLADDPFTHEGAPLMIKAPARKINEWRADSDKVVGPLQDSPARTDEPLETVWLIPSGAARLRITSFPVASNSPGAHVWTPNPVNLAKIKASHSSWPYSPGRLIYGLEPKSSRDTSIPHFSWWDRKGSKEWVQFRFPGPVTVSSVSAYWFIDHSAGQPNVPGLDYQGANATEAPQSWTVQYFDGQVWKEVESAGSYGTLPDQYNLASFKPVTAFSLRVLAQLNEGSSAGLFAVKIFSGDIQIVPTVTPEAEKILAAGAQAGNRPPPDGWYSAANLKLEDGAAVSIWPDGSPNSSDATVFQPDPNKPWKIQPPTFSLHGINGLPSVHFDGAQRQVVSFELPTGDDFTIAMVFQSTAGSGNGKSFTSGQALLQGGGHANSNDYGLSLNADGQVLAGTGNPDTSLVSAPQLNDGKPHVVVFSRIKANGTLSLSVDGGAPVIENSTNFTSLVASDRLGIGATPRGDAAFTGDIGDFYFYSSPLSDAERQSLERELTGKWGIH